MGNHNTMGLCGISACGFNQLSLAYNEIYVYIYIYNNNNNNDMYNIYFYIFIEYIIYIYIYIMLYYMIVCNQLL